MDGEVAAISSVDFDWTRRLQSIWDDESFDAPELNGALADSILNYALNCKKSGGGSPLGRVVVGGAGAGKTHLVGELRRRIWSKGGWFILLDLADVNDFWATATLSYLQSLQHSYRNGIRQGDEILLRLCGTMPVVSEALKSKYDLIFSGSGKEIEALAKAIVEALRSLYPIEVQQHKSVIKSFVLFTARDPGVSDAAYSWLQGVDIEGDPLGPTPSPREVIRGLSWLMSLTGPTLLVIDQIDAIVSVPSHSLTAAETIDVAEEHKARKIIDELATGLMDLRDITFRTVTVLSALEATWTILEKRSAVPVTARFRDPDFIKPIDSGGTAQRIVVGRLSAAYGSLGFVPTYPSWPFRPSAFDGAVDWLPRTLLRRCDAHLRKCLAEGIVKKLESFDELSVPKAPKPVDANIEELFKRLRAEASVDEFLNAEKGETLLPSLLLAALRCYALQEDTVENVDLAVEADPNKRRPALHARLRRIYRSEGDREEHYCFRAIGHPNATAFQSRLKAAITAAGIDMALPFRHLLIIRRDPPPSGPKTRALCDEFKKAGGKFAALGKDGLKTMLALQEMHSDHITGFEIWLKHRKPLCDIALFREVGLCVPADSSGLSDKRSISPSQAFKPSLGESLDLGNRSGNPLQAEAVDSPPSIYIGRRLVGGKLEKPRYLALDLLPRHTAILAGSGSGKTVLLRRIVEEAALQGIPSIVLDTHNDLVRFGDRWPTVPSSWDDAEQDKARLYFHKTEAVVWTPGIASGNPIMLAPMPDFGPVLSDADELQQTIVMAHAALQPLVGATGAKAVLKEGILMQALHHFARSGSEGLDAFVDLLSDLPSEVSNIGNAGKISTDMANLLKAEIAKNPLLSFKGTRLDPAALLTSDAKGRCRISVINFAGLPSDEARQVFVNQLEMALFSWIKKNPSPLTGLIVMDEARNFAPSHKTTPCKESTIALAAQARKYGLGMIFATQAPKDIDNKLVSNCTTHFYGKMNSPTTIDAVRELMAAKGGSGSDIASMKVGEFYFATEGMIAPEKIKAPLCLSHHPQNPLSQDEVVKQARASRL